jgi:ketosteroid isomerase-like protein
MTPRELMTDYIASAKGGDWAGAYGYFHDDIRIRIPGRSARAGEYRGKRHAVDYIETVRNLYGEANIELELVDMLVSDERVLLLVCERFLGDGPPVEIRRANVYRVDGDRIVEIAIYEGDQYVVDELLH